MQNLSNSQERKELHIDKEKIQGNRSFMIHVKTSREVLGDSGWEIFQKTNNVSRVGKTFKV